MIMVSNVLKRSKRLLFDSRNSLIWMIIAGLIVAGLMVFIYPSISEMGADMENYIEQFPEEFMEVFGITETDFSIFEVYISAEYFSMFWAMVFIPFMVAWTSQYAKEAENGTLGLLWSYPISRKETALASLIDSLVKGALSAFFMVGGVVILAQFIDVELIYENWVKMFVLMTAILWAIGALTVALSVLFRNRMRVIGVISAIVVGGYFLNVVAKLYEDLDFVKYVSLFHYYGDPVDVLYNGELNLTSLIVYLGVAVVASIVALLAVDRFDLPKG